MKKFLENHGNVAILGIGNEIKGDDGLGPYIANNLNERFNENKNIAVFIGGSVPENYTGLIRNENPSHIILIDAVEMNKEPGHIRVVHKDEIAKYNISTHAMPISFLIKYMEATINSKIILIGIQPKNMELTHNISKEVKRSIETVVNTVIKLLAD